MWAGIKVESEVQKKDQDRERYTQVFEEIKTHFNGELLDNFFYHNFKSGVLGLIGNDIIIKYGYCENCSHYAGVPSTIRKIKNIPVINSYCYSRARATKPENRCQYFCPSKFHQKLMLNFRERELNKFRSKFDWVDGILNEDYEEDY